PSLAVSDRSVGACITTSRQPSSPEALYLYIASKSRRQRGAVYRVTYAGEFLLDHWNPEFEACRALLAQGLTGKLEGWRPSGDFPGLILDIEKGAKLTVRESVTESVKITKWFPADEDAVCRHRGEAPAARSVAVAGVVATD